ncbi:MAG: hypothetical protein Q9213_008145 [Squamulea squamosa]
MLHRTLLTRSFQVSNQLISRSYHSAMKEAIVQPDLAVNIIDSQIPVPKDDEVITKVVVSGSNPKDWKRPVTSKQAMNSGDDIAGVVHQVGRNVYEFKPGDRIAAFHQMMASGGSFAEYAVSWAHTTFHIPNDTSFEGGFYHSDPPNPIQATINSRHLVPIRAELKITVQKQPPSP